MNKQPISISSFPRKTLSDHSSDNLQDFEGVIIVNVRGIALCKLAICLALARIKKYELYKQVGLSTFHDYLRAKRVKIHYHTAHDYACIGEIFEKYRNNLENVNFTEKDGLRKLLLLERGLNKTGVHREIVFRKLKEASFREFKRFAIEDAQSERPDCDDQDDEFKFFFDLQQSDECIVLKPSGNELLWFDTNLDNWFNSTQSVNAFKKYILDAAKDFFRTKINTINCERIVSAK